MITTERTERERHLADLERMSADRLVEALTMVRALLPYAAHLPDCHVRACFSKGFPCTCTLQETLVRAQALVAAPAERELLTCSQCGAHAQEREHVLQYYIVCTNVECAFQGPRRGARALAIKAWNHINRVA
jgi:hypothetical protein